MSEYIDLGAFYKPVGWQQAAHDNKAVRKVLQIGRRGGKSRWALMELLRVYVESFDVVASKALVPPFHAWIVLPNFSQARQVWNELLTFLPPQMIAPNGIHQEDMFIYLRGGESGEGVVYREWGLVEVKSAFDPAALQTAGVDFLWVSEAQDISDRAFERLIPILDSPERMGRAVFEGIPPRSRQHWFQRLYLATGYGLKNYERFHATTFDNPLLSADQRQEIRDLLRLGVMREAEWNRLFMALFSEEAGFFTNIDACCVGDFIPVPLPGARYVGGLDLGRKSDPTVMYMMDQARRSVVAKRRLDTGQSWIVQRETVIQECSNWGLQRLVVDATGMGGDMFVEELQAAGLPVEPYILSPNNRRLLLDQLVIACERRSVRFPPDDQLLKELRQFEVRKTEHGYKAEAPPGEHDDEVFALALALSACDPPHAVIPGMVGGSLRYLPTDEEAQHGIQNSFGARLLRQRAEERRRLRWSREEAQ